MAGLIEGWFDGCMEPTNPGGHGAWGAAVKVDGEFVYRSGGYIGHGKQFSNNCSEFAGFTAVADECAKHEGVIVIRGDSKLVVNLVNRKWKSKGGLYLPFFAAALKSWDRIRERARLEWISRDYNSVCDELSKQVLRDLGVTFRIQPEFGQPQDLLTAAYRERLAAD